MIWSARGMRRTAIRQYKTGEENTLATLPLFVAIMTVVPFFRKMPSAPNTLVIICSSVVESKPLKTSSKMTVLLFEYTALARDWLVVRIMQHSNHAIDIMTYDSLLLPSAESRSFATKHRLIAVWKLIYILLQCASTNHLAIPLRVEM
jgi:hypothetical protein